MVTRSVAFAPFVLCLLVTAVGARAALPEPPEQHEPWNPPSGTVIPDYVLKAASMLFDAGLADPRKGVYRELEIWNRHNGKDTLETHGWVFPGDYAICWNGLVYRVRAVGGRSDVEQDVRAMLAAQPWHGRFTEPETAGPVFWPDMLLDQDVLPVPVTLLLRLGRADLAAQLWRVPEAQNIVGYGRHPQVEEGRWLATAADAWFGAAYTRLVSAFQAATDQEAADVAESILRWRSRVPSNWRVRNVWTPKAVPDISFLEPVPDLLSDSQRRLRDPKRGSVDLEALSRGGSGSAEFLRSPPAVRIARLIDCLEDVRGEKISIPGRLMYWGDPVYGLLKKEGEGAVGALLDVYENDRRLTRTFDYVRPWSIEHTPVSVHQVVEILLGDILGEPERIRNSTPAELQAWWRQHNSSTRSDRSYKTLADDHASPERWLEAADYLTTRSDIEWGEWGKMAPEGACDPRKAAPAVNGAKLRDRRNPSVSELIAKRTLSLVASGSDIACAMSVKAAMWDPKAAVPVLQGAATLKSCRANHLVAIARLSLGISGAAAEWAAELADRPKFPPLRTEELSPLWMFPADPVIERTAEWLFARPDSLWAPASKYVEIDSPLLAIPIFRRAVMSALEDRTVVGGARRTLEGLLSSSLASGGGGGTSEPGHDPRQAPPGQERPIRVMDMVAWNLSRLDGAPEFGLDWPESDKDAAISAIAEFLRIHEKQLRAFPIELQDTNCLVPSVYFDQ